MKKLMQKTWFTGVLILAAVLIVTILNLLVMTLELDWPFYSDTFFGVASNGFENGGDFIFAFILSLIFYLFFVPIIVAVFSYFRKSNWGFYVAGGFFVLFDVALIAFQSFTGYLPVIAIVLLIFSILIMIAMFTLVIFRSRLLAEEVSEFKSNQSPSKSNVPLLVLINDIISGVAFLTVFFVPLYTYIEYGQARSGVLINVLLGGETDVAVIITFFVFFLFLMGIFLYFANCLTSYFINKELFIKQSKKLINLSLLAVSIFFLIGLVINIYNTLTWDSEISTIAYIPMILMFGVVFFNAILMGKYNDYNLIRTGEKKKKYANVESLILVIILTAVTVFMLFLPIVKINISSGAYTQIISLTGFNILSDYAILDQGYRILAYMLYVMLMAVGFALVMTISSYLSKSKLFHRIVKTTSFTNVFFVFIIAISGYYFQIAREINETIIQDIAEFYNISLPSSSLLEYTIGTDAMYAFLASVVVLVLMFVRKVFDRDELDPVTLEGIGGSGLDESEATSRLSESEDELSPDFDPCYAFTELDSNHNSFKTDTILRRASSVTQPTLNGLVNFVVEYARNSHKHLSYKAETIATFVSGLGASKLSILQGMSGTGKTSLPKIFAEAIYGNCDIVEVESSWKDKNELLGYYNEFSLKYTPKKFTIALYKAALNKDIFTFILLDEMNLSRIEYYFSDFLSLMENEPDEREIKLVNIKLSRKENGEFIDYSSLENGHTLKIPENVWFIGTANRDESTFVISDKVYDRATTMNFTKRAPKVRNYSDPIPKKYYDYSTMNQLFEDAKAKGTFDAEASDLIKKIEDLLAPFNISFGNRILKQIEDFVNIYKECFVNDDVESEAIEMILLSKVVSKLEVKTIEDKEKLQVDFEKLNLYKCAEFIKHLDED